MLAAKLALIAVLVMMPALLLSTGLTLYSYQDDLGQLIVVDSIERVPEKFRDTARRDFIPSFTGGSSASIEIISQPPTCEFISTDPHLDPVADHDLEVLAAPPEQAQVDPALATATLLLGEINTIITNNEKLYGVALNTSIANPIVRHLHLTNIVSLRNITDPRSLTWKTPQSWSDEAAVLIEQLRTIQFSVSRWLESGQTRMLFSTLPSLLATVKRQAQSLETTLETLRLRSGTDLDKAQ